MQGEKAAFRPCAYAEGALTHHGQTLVPGGDRLYLRLEGGGRCTVEPADYSYRQVQAATLDLPGSGPEGQVRYHLRRKRPKTKGQDRDLTHRGGEAQEADERSRLGEWVDDTLVAADPCACLCLPTGQ